uniref:Fatty-acid-binding protein 2 isoform X2 n=1 Tax=Rhizophora mucronata TaxID=61149 RepID=A0A2P2JYP0_RHIMU
MGDGELELQRKVQRKKLKRQHLYWIEGLSMFSKRIHNSTGQTHAPKLDSKIAIPPVLLIRFLVGGLNRFKPQKCLHNGVCQLSLNGYSLKCTIQLQKPTFYY